MSAEQDLFGFENEADEPTVNQVDVFRSKRREFAEYKRSPELNIAEIQRLLKKDLGDESCTQDTEDFESSSIFEDTENSYTDLSVVASSETQSILVNANKSDACVPRQAKKNKENICETDRENTHSKLELSEVAPRETHAILVNANRPKTRLQRMVSENKENISDADWENIHNRMELSEVASSEKYNILVDANKPKTRLQRKAKKNKENKENICETELENVYSELLMPVTRAYSKHGRQKKAVPRMEKTDVIDESVNSSIVKRKRNTKKCKAKRDEEEKLETIAEKINNKFKQVEEFQLVVL